MFTAGTKNKISFMLMIDVDRPNIEIGHNYFSKYFDGETPTSPNNIPYLYLPLHWKQYTDNKRLQIITDNEHHAGNSSVVALQGIQDIDTVVKLANGINTTIRKLLLSIPADGTSKGKLFVQIEKQANHAWKLCCFPSIDAAKVTIQLNTLKEPLKPYIKADDLDKLFCTGQSLIFCGQVAPMPKGRLHLPRTEVPDHIQQSAQRSL
jgi:hypothetical protein